MIASDEDDEDVPSMSGCRQFRLVSPERLRSPFGPHHSLVLGIFVNVEFLDSVLGYGCVFSVPVAA
jgi:hypothetical protein